MPFGAHVGRLTVLILIGEMGAVEAVGCDGGEHSAANGRSPRRSSRGWRVR